VDGLRNEYRFETIRLWEHAERIRSGELAELAPLLVLCEDQPTEETLRRERGLILELEVPEKVRNDLLVLAAMVGRRFFRRETLEALFLEDREMLKEIDFVQEWLAESRREGAEEGLERGLERGREEGRTEMARRLALDLLRERFGDLPAAVVARIQSADAEWCADLARRVARAGSLEELDLT
jgi:predicted transposase YdaD